jgi:hypothetical protein
MSVEGQGLAALQRKLKAAEGGKLLQRELNKALREAAKPLIPRVQESARSTLPAGGGLAERVASSKIRAQVTSGRDPGVVIRASGRKRRELDQGRLRHPVYARPNQTRSEWTWVSQSVPSGWFTDPLRRAAPGVRPHLLAALEETARKIASA